MEPRHPYFVLARAAVWSCGRAAAAAFLVQLLASCGSSHGGNENGSDGGNVSASPNSPDAPGGGDAGGSAPTSSDGSVGSAVSGSSSGSDAGRDSDSSGVLDSSSAEATGTGSSGSPGADAAADAPGAEASSATLAATPPMGWNSWESFRCSLSTALIQGVADAIVSSGMQAAGYEYINLDDCWMDGRDANGGLRWSTTKFPAGIPALASYVHGKGLKFGIYESANAATCVGIYGGIAPSVAVGSLGHEAQDAATFASWGVDFLKYDLCAGDRNSFAKMHDGLIATGRPIVHSINPGNRTGYPPNTPGWNPASISNMWRVAFDISASWASVTSVIDQDATFFAYAGPGHWNDADGLEVGNGLTADEERSQLSMWAILASPLLAGNDVRSMSAATRDVLTNAEVIAIDQDPLGKQGQLVATPQPNVQIWSKPLSGQNARAVALLNRSAAAAAVTVQWTTIGLSAGNAAVRNLWSHMDLGTFSQSFTATVIPSHGVVMLRVTSAP